MPQLRMLALVRGLLRLVASLLAGWVAGWPADVQAVILLEDQARRDTLLRLLAQDAVGALPCPALRGACCRAEPCSGLRRRRLSMPAG